MKRDWLGAACMEWPLLPEWGQDQHLSEPERLSSLLLFFLLNWALALVLSPYLTLTLCDLTLLVLSWPCQQWNFRLIYETKNCIHRFSRGNTVPPLKDHSGPRECITVHRGWAINLNYTSAQTASLKYKWTRFKYSNNFLMKTFCTFWQLLFCPPNFRNIYWLQQQIIGLVWAVCLDILHPRRGKWLILNLTAPLRNS